MNKIIRLIIVVVFTFLSLSSIHAQNTADYVLEPVSVDEFIEAIPTIINEIIQNNPSLMKNGNDIREDLVRVLSDEFWLRYADDVSQVQLSEAFIKLNYGWSAFAFYSPYLDLLRWQKYALELWLIDEQAQLADGEEYTTDIGSVSVREYYMTNSQAPDLVLDASIFIEQKWLARKDDTRSTGYDLIPLSIPYLDGNYSWSQTHGTPLHPQVVEDITGDGRVEFAYTQLISLPASWTHASNHSYVIYSWSEEVDNLEAIFHSDVVDDDEMPWELINLDDDEALEIIKLCRMKIISSVFVLK